VTSYAYALALAILCLPCGVAAQQLEVRDVTPPNMTRVFRSVTPITPARQSMRTFSDVHVSSDGSLFTEGIHLTLYAADLPNRRKICAAASGARWPCGNMAFVALYNLVHNRSVGCSFHDEANRIVVCNLDGIDISAWLLQAGWAELSDGTKEKIYVDAAASATARKSGVWAETPPIK